MYGFKHAARAAMSGALVCAALAPLIAQARDVQLLGPTGIVAVGGSAFFLLSDQQFGDQCEVALGYCAADFAVSYDATVLKYLGATYAGPVALDPSSDLFTAPGPGDADPAGAFNVQLVLTSFIPSGASPIFSLAFKAIAASGAGGSRLSVGPPADAPSYVFQTASATVSVVPEPATAWLMSAALIAGFMALRRQRRDFNC